MDFILITEFSTEWNYMWEWIQNHPINEGLENQKIAENNGAVWEYMGSYMQGKKAIHEFRHISHPSNNETIKLSLASSNQLSDDEIAKRFKIK